MMQYTAFLSTEEVEKIHDTSLDILENIGVRVHLEQARDIFAKHGCKVDPNSQVVKLPRKVVEFYRQAFVPSFTFRGRDSHFDRTIPDDRPVVVTASSAPNLIDPVSGEERRATSDDIANIAFLINELPGYDIFSISTLANDAPKGQLSLWRFYPALKNCLKPVRSNTPNMKELLQVLELGALIAGSEDAYKERPLINHHCCPVVSPLTMDSAITEQLIYLTERGLPVYCTIAPNGGMTSPMSLLGTLAVGNAEFLVASVLMQMVRPETPLIYAVLSTVADMRKGNYAPGGIETGIMQMGHCQMARFYNVPCGGYIGLTNAHMDDVQSGYETGMGATSALLGGADMFNMGGLLSSLLTFDFGKAVIDNEIGLMLKRIHRGLEFSTENLSLELISKVGNGGSYTDEVDTFNRMRTTALLPSVAFRDVRAAWEDMGKSDAHSRALTEARKILTRDNPAVLSPRVDDKIRARFQGLTAGNAGWS
ncbi:Trimethylamine methyltransferase mttB (EC (TMA methyltransferase) [Olavius algarvensis Delta 1 endosymbiont]|nr:Trimethylamine methyltransferase mttB (EC (TMA methyltransferase) [Olavius algarvensis Delta 1 endosymbiont]